MRDLASNIGPTLTVAPGVYSADQAGATVDLLGFDGAAIVIHAGVGGITFTNTNKVEVIVEHSDDGTTWAAVAQADIVGATVTGAGIVKDFKAAHAAAATYKSSYIGTKRYLRATLDFSGTHGTGTGFAVSILRGRAASRPVA